MAVRGLQTLTISVAEPGGWSLKVKKTQATFAQWVMPLVLGYAECGRDSCPGRPVFGSVVHTLNAFDPIFVDFSDRPRIRIDGECQLDHRVVGGFDGSLASCGDCASDLHFSKL